MPARILRLLILLAASCLLLNGVVFFALGKLNVGTIGPFLLGLVVLLLLQFRERWLLWLDARRWRRPAWRLVLLLFTVWLLSLLVFFVTLARHPQPDATRAPAAIIVLGSGLDGREPGPMLRLRLDAALVYAGQFPQAKLVVSGGQGWSEEISEAQAMQEYLQRHGVAPARILAEDRSTSTEENLGYSKRVLQAAGIDVGRQNSLIVTSDFHTLRAEGLARRHGYGAAAVAGAQTPLPIRYNAWFREYFASLSSWVLGEYD